MPRLLLLAQIGDGRFQFSQPRFAFSRLPPHRFLLGDGGLRLRRLRLECFQLLFQPAPRLGDCQFKRPFFPLQPIKIIGLGLPGLNFSLGFLPGGKIILDLGCAGQDGLMGVPFLLPLLAGLFQPGQIVLGAGEAVGEILQMLFLLGDGRFRFARLFQQRFLICQPLGYDG